MSKSIVFGEEEVLTSLCRENDSYSTLWAAKHFFGVVMVFSKIRDGNEIDSWYALKTVLKSEVSTRISIGGRPRFLLSSQRDGVAV